ncbi:MAG: ATP-binding protein [Caldilineaceae bacterium]
MGALLQQLRPVVRVEQPFVPPALIGRDELVAQVHAALADDRSVSLTGAGGVGKSALAATVADQWPTPAVFWYTIRPNSSMTS